MTDLLVGIAHAQDGAPAPPGGQGFELLLFFGSIIAIWWFLVLRPQTKQAKAHKEMVTGLIRGDSVMTNSGMFGKVATVDEATVTLEVSKGIRIRFLKDKVARRVDPGSEGKDSDSK